MRRYVFFIFLFLSILPATRTFFEFWNENKVLLYPCLASSKILDGVDRFLNRFWMREDSFDGKPMT